MKFFIICLIICAFSGVFGVDLIQKIQEKKDLPIIIADIQNQLRVLNDIVGVNSAQINRNTVGVATNAAGVASNSAGISSNSAGITANKSAFKGFVGALAGHLGDMTKVLKPIPLLASFLTPVQAFVDILKSL